MITGSINILTQLQYPSGVFSASSQKVSTGYDKAWLRDCIYEVMGLEAVGKTKEVERTMQALFQIFLKHEYKIDHAIKEKPRHRFQYIHARYHPITFEEFYEEWGNKQNDAVGAFLFKVGELEEKGYHIVRNDVQKRILKKLVLYLKSIEYWHDDDNGMWEENEEVHASSIGACVAGLKKISKLIDVPKELISKGEQTLRALLPRESITKHADLSLLSLIFPYNVVTKKEREQILSNVETLLVREKGVIRYINDQYYNKNGEAEWTMGFPWLAIIYKNLSRPDKYAHYLRLTLHAMNEKGELPELYYANTNTHNENTPLGWAQSLYVVAIA